MNETTNNVEQAKQAIEENRQQRVQACQTELQELLQKHQCELNAFVIVGTRGNEVRIEINPN